MRKTSVYFFAFLVGCANGQGANAEIDERLVGDWIGEREKLVGCFYYSWKVNRDKEGTYRILFYGDPKRSQLIHSESGKWWVRQGDFYEQVEGVMKKPDIYNYRVISAEEVYFEQVSADKTGVCKGDYSFTDIRVNQHPSNN